MVKKQTHTSLIIVIISLLLLTQCTKQQEETPAVPDIPSGGGGSGGGGGGSTDQSSGGIDCALVWNPSEATCAAASCSAGKTCAFVPDSSSVPKHCACQSQEPAICNVGTEQCALACQSAMYAVPPPGGSMPVIAQCGITCDTGFISISGTNCDTTQSCNTCCCKKG